MKSNDISSNHITTNDLALSAYLKMQGYQLIKLNSNKSKSTFIFEIENQDASELKVEFINSEFLKFYKEIRNLKKLIS